MNNQNEGLVDKLIFEVYKDKAVCSMKGFKKEIKSNYGLIPSSDLYRTIINYQINKYGKQLNVDLCREYEKNFLAYSKKKRERNVKRVEEKAKEERLLEKIYRQKRR